jgi:hypothetical protein
MLSSKSLLASLQHISVLMSEHMAIYPKGTNLQIMNNSLLLSLLWVNASCCVYDDKIGIARPSFATTFQRVFYYHVPLTTCFGSQSSHHQVNHKQKH